MLITLIRHAEVDEAYHKCYNGHIDIGLSSKGKQEAEKLAHYFKNKTFDAVFSSDLKRCKQTLKAFDLDIKPVYTAMLREKSWGRHEGKGFDEIIQMEEFRYEDFEQWINALDGEAYPEYIKRVKGFFTGFLPASASGDILVMTHAGVIRVLMHILQEISLEEAFCKPFGYADHITLDTDTWSFTKETIDFKDLQCV